MGLTVALWLMPGGMLPLRAHPAVQLRGPRRRGFGRLLECLQPRGLLRLRRPLRRRRLLPPALARVPSPRPLPDRALQVGRGLLLSLSRLLLPLPCSRARPTCPSESRRRPASIRLPCLCRSSRWRTWPMRLSHGTGPLLGAGRGSGRWRVSRLRRRRLGVCLRFLLLWCFYLWYPLAFLPRFLLWHRCFYLWSPWWLYLGLFYVLFVHTFTSELNPIGVVSLACSVGVTLYQQGSLSQAFLHDILFA